jgi:hypothetical protein
MTLNNIAAAPSTTFPQGAIGEDVVVGDEFAAGGRLGAKMVGDDNVVDGGLEAGVVGVDGGLRSAFLVRECIYDFLFL